ncbi:histone-fold-containing protein [Hymenopellis radicata]|nr:histone-fold-containing protein [Hymenopellis radicata]
MVRKDPITGSISAQAQQDLVSEGIENFELPKSIITKIARSAIPENAKLQKETILSLVKGSTVFVNYLGAAHDVAISKQHKSISATDVLRALEVLELGDLVDGLQSELQIYRELAKTDKSKKGTSTIISASSRGKQTASSASAPPATPAGSPLKIQLKQKEKPGAVALPRLSAIHL